MKISSKRIIWLDIMKALLIISVIIGHSTSPLVTYVYLFHMPAFFAVSGYVYHGERYSFESFFLKKSLTLFVPAFLINLLYIIFYCLMQNGGWYRFFSSTESLSFLTRLELFFRYLGTPDLGGATWFLFVLFEVEVLFRVFNVIVKKLKSDWIMWVLVAISSLFGYILVSQQYILPYYIDLTFMASLYYGAGVFASKFGLFTRCDVKIMLPLSIILTAFFGEFYFSNELPMNWPTRSFAPLFIQIISCLAATYLIWYISISLEKTKLSNCLQWIGQHTYCILITHFAVFRLLFGLGVLLNIYPITILQSLTPTYDIAKGGGWLLITILTVLICSTIAWLAEKNRITNYIFNAKV